VGTAVSPPKPGPVRTGQGARRKQEASPCYKQGPSNIEDGRECTWASQGTFSEVVRPLLLPLWVQEPQAQS
jgi:hypothetical protein